jgi:hypothetical protein
MGWDIDFFEDFKAILSQVDKAQSVFKMSKFLPVLSDKILKDTVRLHHRRRLNAE